MGKMQIRDYQQRAIDEIRASILAGNKKPLMVLPTGAGKCLAKGTRVLLYSGEVRAVENICVGDVLMGPDSKPRRVLSTCSGFGPMLRVTPKKGEPYDVTYNHVLSLKQTNTNKKPKYPSQGKVGSIVNIPAWEYLSKSKWFKHIHKTYRVGVDFKENKSLRLDPYFLGIWLGDGTSRFPQITSEDGEIIGYVQDYCDELGLDCVIKSKKNKCCTVSCYTKKRKRSKKNSNQITEGLRFYGLLKNKHIPKQFKCNSPDVRLRVLAGIIDTDGHYDGKGYSITLKSEKLIDDVIFVARSLGFSAYKSCVNKKCCNNCNIRGYFSTSISGNIDKIPCILPRKKANKRRQKKDVLVSSITVEPIGNNEWFGFEVDKDHLFLLGDFTVTHNSVVFAKIIESIFNNDKKVLWVVHRRNLVFQMKETLSHFNVDSGIIMAGVESELDKKVQLCTIQSYARRLNVEDLAWNKFYFDADIVLVDEAHRSISRTYRQTLRLYLQKTIIGCTATPARADGRGLGELYDDIINVIGVRELTERGFLSPVRYFVPERIDLSGVKIHMGDYQAKSLEEKTNKPKIIGDIIQNWLKLAENRKTLVFCVNVKHSIAVCEAFNRAGITAEHLDARSSDEEREAVFERVEKGATRVLCNVAIYQEGLDVPSIGCVVIARPTKSMGLYRQMAGRGLRIEKDKENLILLDHGNVIEEHGLLDWDIKWKLDGKKKAWSKPTRKDVKKLVRCRACGLTFHGSRVCPDCGTEVISFGQDIPTIDAELEELKKNKEKGGLAEKRLFLGMLKAWVPKQKNPNPKRIFGAFKGRYGISPEKKYAEVEPIEPTAEFLNYMKYQNIKWAKRRYRGYKTRNQK